MEVQISRDGTVIGVLQLEELSSAVAGGSVLLTDYGWHDGMPEWKLVSELVNAPKKGKKASPKKAPKEKRDWRQAPATEKQIQFLKSFSVTIPSPLTKGDASDLIDKCINDPETRRVREEKQFADRERTMEQARKVRASEGAFSFRKDVEKAKREVDKESALAASNKASTSAKKKELATLQKKLAGAADDEYDELELRIDGLEDELIELETDPLDLQGYKEELKEAQTARLKFWKSTFKEDWINSEDASEYEVLIDVGATIDRLHDEYGQFFKTPTNKQISDILQALDDTSSEWDRVQPEAFYARLHKNFPDQMRPGASVRQRGGSKQTRAKSRGCLVLIAGFITLAYLFARA